MNRIREVVDGRLHGGRILHATCGTQHFRASIGAHAAEAEIILSPSAVRHCAVPRLHARRMTRWSLRAQAALCQTVRRFTPPGDLTLEDTRATSVLVLGACGMLGNAVLRVFARSPGYKVVGTARSSASRELLPEWVRSRVIVGVDVENFDGLARVMAQQRPQVVINCIGLVKQLAQADDPLAALPINSLLPHRLARLCELVQARLVHISTDCVFSGARGAYTEDDTSDAVDLYGRSKLLGEVDYPHAVTLRTSIIGHELNGANGLVGWFLSQRGQVKGFRKAVFSGLPTVVLAQVIRDHVLTHPNLRGLHHVSAAAINKFELLSLIAKVYGSTTTITPDDALCIDRSLDSTKFRVQTGFLPDEWPELVRQMHAFQLEAPNEQA